MPRRPALLLAALLVAATQLPSHAHAPKPQITDPAGDAIGAQPGADIVSATYATTGTGSGRSYKPKKLVVTMTMAGDVITTPGLTYEVEAMTSSCDVVTFTAEQGTPYSTAVTVNGWASWGSCTKTVNGEESNLELITVVAKGKTLTWSFSLKMVPKALAVGTAFSDFEARVDPTNPVVPLPSSDTGTALGLVDIATGTGTWKLG